VAAGGLAATVQLEVEFRKPMFIGKTYKVRARCLGEREGRHEAEGEVTTEDGKVIARGRGRFAVLSEAAMKRFLGEVE
jgi:acyl-coenzyme A thioesterase PaaI-like protein